MRTAVRGLKAILIVLAVSACGAAAALLWHAPLFEMGMGYELYLSPSSSSLIVSSSDPLSDKLRLLVRGESVRYDGDKKDALIARFHAKVLFTEEVAGVTNYYCASPFLRDGIVLNGKRVGLHIAVSEGQTVVGAPLIFGGA